MLDDYSAFFTGFVQSEKSGKIISFLQVSGNIWKIFEKNPVFDLEKSGKINKFLFKGLV